VLAIVGALGILGYVIAVLKIGEKFTEFYILGLEGTATDYPKELRVGEEGKVTVGIINWEYEAVTYGVEVRIDGVTNTQVKPIVFEHEEKWEGKISFVLKVCGDNQKIEFLLYKNGGLHPIRSHFLCGLM